MIDQGGAAKTNMDTVDKAHKSLLKLLQKKKKILDNTVCTEHSNFMSKLPKEKYKINRHTEQQKYHICSAQFGGLYKKNVLENVYKLCNTYFQYQIIIIKKQVGVIFKKCINQGLTLSFVIRFKQFDLN